MSTYGWICETCGDYNLVRLKTELDASMEVGYHVSIVHPKSNAHLFITKNYLSILNWHLQGKKTVNWTPVKL